jgi:predicted RNA-binding Zn ribbon-like protein
VDRFDRVGNDLAVDFANTVYAPDDPSGSLRSWRDAVAFLEATGAVDAGQTRELRALVRDDPATPDRLWTRTLALRDAIRRALDAIEKKRRLAPDAIEPINEILAADAGQEQLVARKGRWVLAYQPQHPADVLRVLVPIARAAAQLIAAQGGRPVRRCANPVCVRYFVDESRTGRRRWCSMALCGNRAKVAAHARRHRRPISPR